MGWAFCEQPDVGHVLTALRMALLVDPGRGPHGGVPLRLHSDHGAEFAASAIGRVCGMLVIDHTTTAQTYRPDLNGVVERFNATIDQLFLCQLPGYTKGPRDRRGRLYGPIKDDLQWRSKATSLPAGRAPLPLTKLVELFYQFAQDYNTQHHHSELDGQTPLETWQADLTAIRTVEPSQLRELLLSADTRTIEHHGGIRFGNLFYRAKELTGRVGTEVTIRYLNAAAIVQAALLAGADAVHPGYGFLSEDADFAKACAGSGLVFVGPPAEVIRALGTKSTARVAMAATGLPLLPGSVEPVDGVAAANRVAAEIGYPLIIKAVAGGGGRGIQVVSRPDDLVPAFRETTASARLLFGDGRVYLERYLTAARHVEVQVLCDAHGNGVHLGERDCSVQRRHQKLVEETPAPNLPADLTGRMADAAVRGMLAAGYTGAGTVEFLVSPAGEFFFMEVNCRIQVEHPVTEMVTGVDLVAEQLRVAAGERLRLRQRDVVARGASIECRINAEDADHGFVPTPGTLTEFAVPGGPFVRVDTHAHAGYRIPAAYDSLLAKLVVWGGDRAEAVRRMDASLAEFVVAGPGVRTTIGHLRTVLAHPRFTAGRHDTRLLDEMAAAAVGGSDSAG